jgi:hypothetical protein
VSSASCSLAAKEEFFYAANIRRMFLFVRNIWIRSFVSKMQQTGMELAYLYAPIRANNDN